MRTPAWLALEDGTVFRGFSCGARGEAAGELVFNTSMTGYQEVLTDPSYKGQLVAMTYPQIGNYGVAHEDDESGRPALEGFVARELCRAPSNWRSVEPLDLFLRRHGIPAIDGIDTRALTLRLRAKGALRAVLSTESSEGLVRRARAHPSLSGRDLARTVTCVEAYDWLEPLPPGPNGLERMAGTGPEPARDHSRGERPLVAPRVHGADPTRDHSRGERPLVVVLDFGVKRGILRCLVSSGCRVRVVPASTSARDILALGPEGVLLSNGPGDPEPLTDVVETVRALLDARVPIFGICLGHQLLGLALGGRTYKLKFGHHGANHPVQDLATGRVEVTTQNHGFCVDLSSLPKSVRTTHVNLNDRTSEGLAHAELPAFSVQYHPEASAGPHDSRYLFLRFKALMDARRGARRERVHA